jgi:hypothetical protein
LKRSQKPAATTLRAKGLCSEYHPLSLGAFGYADTRHASELMPGRREMPIGQASLGDILFGLLKFLIVDCHLQKADIGLSIL